MKKIKAIAIVSVLLGSFITTQADLLVGFAPSTNYVTANVNAQGRVNGGVLFSMTSVRSPSSGYTGPVYFGGATGSVAISSWLFQNSTPDYFAAGGNSTGIGSRVSAVIMFTNQSASITQIVYSTRLGGSASSQTNYTAFVVRKDDGSFYISQKTPRTVGFVATNSNLSALTWYNYSPNTSLNDLGAIADGFELKNITAVGEWQENIITVSGNPGVGITTFQAFGTIPEPATIGMLGLGSLIVLSIRRAKA